MQDPMPLQMVDDVRLPLLDQGQQGGVLLDGIWHQDVEVE